MEKWVTDFKSQLNDLDLLEDKNEWVKRIKELDLEMLDQVRNDLFTAWKPGKGFESSRIVTLCRDWIVEKCILRARPDPNFFSIVAVGGYGRGELSPCSDLDILVLHNSEVTDLQAINRLLYLLWDLGYQLGNSVRDIDNSVEHAAKDITFLTSLFESRLLWGNLKILNALMKRITHVVTKKRSSYTQEKLQELQLLFHLEQNFSLLLKEPHLKENPGGLRGAHVAEWVYFAYEGKGGFEPLLSLLDSETAKLYKEAYDFILGIRNILHLISSRKEDVLSMDQQSVIAEWVGKEKEKKGQMIGLMKKVYRSFVQIFTISYRIVDFLYFKYERKTRRHLGKFFLKSGGEFFVEKDGQPDTLFAFSAVLECIKQGLIPSHQFLQFLQDATNEIKTSDRSSHEVFELFVDILSLDRSFQALNLLKLSGFLYAYFPAFKEIEHLIIYNPFHRFTVDEHSIQSVHAIDKLFSFKYTPFELEKVNFLIELAEKHKNALWILKLALLMHDLGKAYEGDHSKNGVEIAEKIFEVLPVSYRYQGLILFLIENHLLLSQYARRANFGEREILFDLSRKFMLTPYPVEYLDFLVLMTYADTFATDPKNYTGYFSALLKDLAIRLKQTMSGQLDQKSKQLLFTKKLDVLSKSIGRENTQSFLDEMGERYSTELSDSEILTDYQLLFEEDLKNPKMRIQAFVEYLKVKIYSQDRIGLFSVLSGILALHGANVVKAEIHTVKKKVVDVFYVTDVFGAYLTKPNQKKELELWFETIKESLQHYFVNPEQLGKRIQDQKNRTKPIPKMFQKDPHVLITQKHANGYLIGISGNDRRILLYEIARYFSKHQIPIKSAIIDTIGWHVKDFFEVELPDSFDENQQNKLKKGLELLVRKSVWF